MYWFFDGESVIGIKDKPIEKNNFEISVVATGIKGEGNGTNIMRGLLEGLSSSNLQQFNLIVSSADDATWYYEKMDFIILKDKIVKKKMS